MVDEILRRLDRLDENMGTKVDSLTAQVSDLSGAVRANREVLNGEVRRLEQAISFHAATQTREHAGVKEEVDDLLDDVSTLKAATAVNTSKVALLSGGAVATLSGLFQAARAFFSDQ